MVHKKAKGYVLVSLAFCLNWSLLFLDVEQMDFFLQHQHRGYFDPNLQLKGSISSLKYQSALGNHLVISPYLLCGRGAGLEF
jgi:hypothetical protein